MGKLGRTIIFIIGGGLLAAIAVAWVAGQYNPELDYIWPGRREAALKVRACIENTTFEYNGMTYRFVRDKHFFITSDPQGKYGFTVAMFNFFNKDPRLASSVERIKNCHPSWKWMWMPGIVERAFKETHR